MPASILRLPFFCRTIFLPSSFNHDSRTSLPLSQKVFYIQAKYAESELDGSVSLRVVPPMLLAAEKEEAKAVLSLFLKKQGLTNVAAGRIVNKSEAFIDHLVSQLHSVYKSRYLVGRELTTLEIRGALIPYLEILLEENGPILIDMIENFSILPVEEEVEESDPKEPIVENSVTPVTTLDSKKLKDLSRVSDITPSGQLPPHIVYLIELGMEIDAIKEVIRKLPAFAYYSLDGDVKPLVQFLLGLGITQADIPSILTKSPQLCGISLTENLIPTMGYLEDLGVDKKQWAKVIQRCPQLLTYSRERIKETVDFLYEMGVSPICVGKILVRFPTITNYSVEENLRPAAEYFRSLDVNVAILLHRVPQAFTHSVETHLKPVTEFFVDKGFSLKDVITMVSRFGSLYSYSLHECLVPKLEFYETMVYTHSELIKFPQYFGYSLEDRIKPRYEMLKQSTVKMPLNQMLMPSDGDFRELLKKKLQKKLSD